jgi:hypothetical protein
MARAWNKLSANFVRSVSKRGRYADGGNLQLQIAKGGSKAWVFAYQRNGVIRSMGLGSARSVPLALARELAGDCREQLARGCDPIDARKSAAHAQRAARAKLMTFKACAEEYHTANVTRWTNADRKRQPKVSPWPGALQSWARTMLTPSLEPRTEFPLWAKTSAAACRWLNRRLRSIRILRLLGTFVVGSAFFRETPLARYRTLIMQGV